MPEDIFVINYQTEFGEYAIEGNAFRSIAEAQQFIRELNVEWAFEMYSPNELSDELGMSQVLFEGDGVETLFMSVEYAVMFEKLTEGYREGGLYSFERVSLRNGKLAHAPPHNNDPAPDSDDGI